MRAGRFDSDQRIRHPLDVVTELPTNPNPYDAALRAIVELLETARKTAARAVNTVITATYWEIGHRIVEFEQAGQARAGYGQAVMERLSEDLSKRFGRGFSRRNLENMRRFYQTWPAANATAITEAPETTCDIAQTVSAVSPLRRANLQLPWSHYIELLRLTDAAAREFYERESLVGGWSIRQLRRQIGTQFYERAALSRKKAEVLREGEVARTGDVVTPEQEIKDPYVLEFLDLKDEYSESDPEEALIRKLEDFLLELGDDFTFVGRQRRLRIGDRWYRLDLLFFHRRLRCLVVIDLKLGEFDHADADQMHLYLNYAREHWTLPHENPPVGLILCSSRDDAVAHYALEGLPNKILAAEYRTALPQEAVLATKLKETRETMVSCSGFIADPGPH